MNLRKKLLYLDIKRKEILFAVQPTFRQTLSEIKLYRDQKSVLSSE